MKYYFYVNDADSSVQMANMGGDELPPAPSPFPEWQPVEVTEVVYRQYIIHLGDMAEVTEKHMILADGEYSIVGRPFVPCAINKTNLLANGVDFVQITGIPVGSRVKLFPAVMEWGVEDGVFELTITTPGAYTLSVKCFGYQTKEFVINAS